MQWWSGGSAFSCLHLDDWLHPNELCQNGIWHKPSIKHSWQTLGVWKSRISKTPPRCGGSRERDSQFALVCTYGEDFFIVVLSISYRASIIWTNNEFSMQMIHSYSYYWHSYSLNAISNFPSKHCLCIVVFGVKAVRYDRIIIFWFQEDDVPRVGPELIKEEVAEECVNMLISSLFLYIAGNVSSCFCDTSASFLVTHISLKHIFWGGCA